MPHEDDPELISDLEITSLFDANNGQSEEARAELAQRTYDLLRARARQILRGEQHSIQPTEVVNSAWMRILQMPTRTWVDRKHFLRFAARTMRSIVIDRARKRNAAKRGGKYQQLPLDDIIDKFGASSKNFDLVDLHNTLDKFREQDEESANIVEMLTFAGYTKKELAAFFGISEKTVKSRCISAGYWFSRELSKT